jgi:hypothetical protein
VATIPIEANVKTASSIIFVEIGPEFDFESKISDAEKRRDKKLELLYRYLHEAYKMSVGEPSVFDTLLAIDYNNAMEEFNKYIKTTPNKSTSSIYHFGILQISIRKNKQTRIQETDYLTKFLHSLKSSWGFCKDNKKLFEFVNMYQNGIIIKKRFLLEEIRKLSLFIKQTEIQLNQDGLLPVYRTLLQRTLEDSRKTLISVIKNRESDEE